MGKPFPFHLKFYKYSIDETIMLQRYMAQTIGDEECRKLFFNFLMEQIASSFPIISKTIIEHLLNMIDFTKEPIPYERWRDKLLGSVFEYWRNELSQSDGPLLVTYPCAQESHPAHQGGKYIRSVQLRDQFFIKYLKVTLPDFIFEDNIFAYFYDRIYDNTFNYYCILHPHMFMQFMCRLSMTPKNGLKKKLLDEFIKDILKAKDYSSQKTDYSLNLPNQLMNLEMPFFPPKNCTWPDRLYKIFPNILTDWKFTEDDYKWTKSFEYYDNDQQRKTGQINIGITPIPEVDYDLSIRFCDSSVFTLQYDVREIYSDILIQLEERVKEIEDCFGEIRSSPCECCFDGIYCVKCKEVSDFIDQMMRINNYVIKILDLGCQTKVRRSKDIKRLERLIEEAKRKLKEWKSSGKIIPSRFNTYFLPKGSNMFILVNECNGKYHFEKFYTEEGSTKVTLILPILNDVSLVSE